MARFNKSIIFGCFLPIIFICYGVLLYEDTIKTIDQFALNPTPTEWSKSPINNGIERFNITYDRERECLSRTYDYAYPLQWNKFNDPIILWEWNYSTYHHDIRPDQSIIVTVYDYLNVADLVIESILKLSRGKYELIVVLDAVDDESILNLTQSIRHFNYECSLTDFATSSISKEYLIQNTLIHEYCVDYKHKLEWQYTCGWLQRIALIRA
eukprot:1055543_1